MQPCMACAQRLVLPRVFVHFRDCMLTITLKPRSRAPQTKARMAASRKPKLPVLLRLARLIHKNVLEEVRSHPPLVGDSLWENGALASILSVVSTAATSGVNQVEAGVQKETLV